jgi:hypothetical protein
VVAIPDIIRWGIAQPSYSDFGCCGRGTTLRTTGLVVNQTYQIQLIGHRRELAKDGLPSQEKSTVVHNRIRASF